MDNEMRQLLESMTSEELEWAREIVTARIRRLQRSKTLRKKATKSKAKRIA
jgi:hypothetical protein